MGNCFSSFTKSAYKFCVFVGISLVDMYAKCGCMEDDAQEFEQQDAILKCNHLGCIVLGRVKCRKYVEGTLNICNK